MDDLKQEMIDAAIKKHEVIYPAGVASTLHECFTRHNDKLMFWFNKQDKSTAVMVREIPPNN